MTFSSGLGSCIFLMILSSILGRKVNHIDPELKVFKANFFKKVEENLDKFFSPVERINVLREEKKPSTIDFGHEPYNKSCSTTEIHLLFC